MKRIVLAAVVVSGCKWTDFDDLADQTWAQSTTAPNVGSTDYAIALAGTTTDPSGGRLSVIGNDTPTYSTLIYDAKGNAKLGPNPERLASHAIASLDGQPVFAADHAGHIVIAAAATSAGFITVHGGAADAPADTSLASAAAPDAATFAAASIVVAAGPNLFVVNGTTAKVCAPTDDTAAPLAAIALAADDVSVWAWTRTGKLISYSQAALAACVDVTMSTTGTAVAPNAGAFDAGFAPGAGAVVQISGSSTSAHEYIVLAAHADQATTGMAIAVDATSLAQTSAFAVDGLQSAALGSFGSAGSPFLALGFPDRAVGSTTTGQVDLHAFDPTSGLLAEPVAETLNDDQPDAGEQFGRAIGTMKFNGTDVLVVAAKNEVFAYFQTLSYPETRQQ